MALVVMLVGFALRLHRLGAESLWLDEMGQASMASGTLLEALAGAKLHHGAAPLDYVLTWLALHIAHQEFMVRLPAAMLGTLTLALVYRLGRELFDRPAGLLAALLLTVAPLHLRYSQEARFYALFTSLAVAATLALVIARRRNDRLSWITYTISLTAGLYSHYYMPLVVLVHGLWVVGVKARRKLIPPFVLSCLVAAIAFLPWFFYAVVGETGTPRATSPTLNWALAQQIVAGLVWGVETGEAPRWLLWLYAGLAILGAATGLARRRVRPATLLVLLPPLLAPPLIVLALRQVGYFFSVRQVLFLLPFFLLLVAQGAVMSVRWPAIGARERGWEGVLRGALAIGLILLLLWPLAPAVQALDRLSRQDWRNALGFVMANAGKNDVIMVPRVPNHYFRYYVSQDVERFRVPGSLADMQAMSESSPAAWTLIVPQAYDVGEAIRAWLEEAGFLRLDFGPNMTVYYWQPGRSLDQVLHDSLKWTLPGTPIALGSLGDAYTTADMPDAASNAFGRAALLANGPEMASHYEMLRGNVWRTQGEHDRAIAAFRQAVVLWPENVEALIRLGEQLLLQGQVDEAAASLEQARRLDPDSYWAWRLLADARSRQKWPEEAIAAYRAAIAINPDEPETYFRLGKALSSSGDKAGAIAAYEQYLALAPDGPRVAEVQERLAAMQAGAR